jgi:hypothetical protein
MAGHMVSLICGPLFGIATSTDWILPAAAPPADPSSALQDQSFVLIEMVMMADGSAGRTMQWTCFLKTGTMRQRDQSCSRDAEKCLVEGNPLHQLQADIFPAAFDNAFPMIQHWIGERRLSSPLIVNITHSG